MPGLDRILTNAVRETPDPAALFSGRYRTYGTEDAGDFSLVPSFSSPTWAQILGAEKVGLMALATNGRMTEAQAQAATRLTLNLPALSQRIVWEITDLEIVLRTVFSFSELYRFTVTNPTTTGGSSSPSLPSNFDFSLDQVETVALARKFWCRRMDLRPRDIIRLTTLANEETAAPVTVVELEDTIFRVRFSPFWEIGVSFNFSDGVEDGAWVVYGIARVGGRARYLDLLCRRQDDTT